LGIFADNSQSAFAGFPSPEILPGQGVLVVAAIDRNGALFRLANSADRDYLRLIPTL